MIKINVAFVGFFLILSLAVSGQVNVIHVNNPASRPIGNGIYYSLPRTKLRVDVLVKVNESLKGPLSEYAERYLGIQDAVKTDNSIYTISNVTITPLAEPDPEQVYYVEMGQRDSRDPRLLMIELDKSGFLVSANGLDAQDSKNVNVERKIVVDDDGITYGGNNNFVLTGRVNISTDTIIRRVAVDTSTVEQLSFRTRTLDKPAQDFATEMMDKIEELRDSRFKLLTGFQETAYETGTVRYMDEQLQKIEAQYIALFRGISTTHFETHTFYYSPQNDQEKNPVALFKFSSSSGISPAKGGVGENAELSLESLGSGQLINGFSDANRADVPQNGIAYRVPANAKATLKIGKDEIHSEFIQINQLGNVRRLPPHKFKAEFSPETGGIKSLLIE